MTLQQKNNLLKSLFGNSQAMLGVIRDDIQKIMDGDDKLPGYYDGDDFVENEETRAQRIKRYTNRVIENNKRVVKILSKG